MLADVKGLIFDIQSYSVHDGPGCRTLVFMMGCPLRCEWCANPEGMEARQRLMHRASKCVHKKQGCTRCIDSCPVQALAVNEQEDSIEINWELCRACDKFHCTKACLSESLVICGKWITVDNLMKMLNRDRKYWAGNGGVTFSGGEPTQQKDFLLAALKRCREAYIHTAIETSACAPTEVFLECMKYVDFAFIDIKHMNASLHKSKTGVSNELTLKNITALKNSDWPGRLIIRMPVIADFNDTEENAVAMIGYLKELGLREINILPFHRLGDSKWNQCGMVYPYREYEGTSDEVLSRLQDLYLSQDILCYVGHETPF